MKVYVASSWRNQVYPQVLEVLRGAGHEVYDFREQGVSWDGFEWNVTDGVNSGELLDVLNHPGVRSRFQRDMDALVSCDAVVCVLPCGRSAHLELGFGIGTGKRTVLLWHDGDEPDIMHNAVDSIVFSLADIPLALEGAGAGAGTV
jgi:hypothetical protein